MLPAAIDIFSIDWDWILPTIILSVMLGFIGVRLIPIEPGLEGCLYAIYLPIATIWAFLIAFVGECLVRGNCL